MVGWHHERRSYGTRRGGTVADPQKNKQTVLDYYTLAFNYRKPAEAVEKYGGSHYIQHNPMAADGFDAFIQFVLGFAARFALGAAIVAQLVAWVALIQHLA